MSKPTKYALRFLAILVVWVLVATVLPASRSTGPYDSALSTVVSSALAVPPCPKQVCNKGGSACNNVNRLKICTVGGGTCVNTDC
jgi:hypothetical protein